MIEVSPLPTALLLLVFSLFLHLLEEIHQDFRRNLPIGEMPRWLFVGLNMVIYGYAALMLIWSFQEDPRALPMAWLFTIGMTLNGLGHLGYMLLRRSYFPGGWTAGLLLIVSINVFRVLLL